MKLVSSWKHKLVHVLEAGMIVFAAFIFKDLLDFYLQYTNERDLTKKIQKQYLMYFLHIIVIIFFDLLLVILLEYLFNETP